LNGKEQTTSVELQELPVAKSPLKIRDVFEAHRGECHVAVLHDFPDPDAISSAFAHKLISLNFDIEVDIIYRGKISHQQNIALVKLLGLSLIRYDNSLDLSRYDGAVFVDNQGTSCETIVEALENAGVPALFVVDHHEFQDRLQPEYSDIRRTGSTATIYAGYLEQLAEIDTSQKEHVIAATALMHGIMTDTNHFIKANDEDFNAAAFLSRFRDAGLLQQIMSQAHSKQVMEIIRQALGNRVTVENYSIAGIGYLRSEDRDAIPQAADFLLTEENVHTAIVYGIIRTEDPKEEALVGSLRTSKITLDPDDFIKDVLGKNEAGRYFGGGKELAGGFEVPIGFLSGDVSEEFSTLKWGVYDEQVKQKIFAKIGVKPARPQPVT
jgi:nanoRNase/pAp phosphatase (c-di-AMP/oligoRNAs hydrolase)